MSVAGLTRWAIDRAPPAAEDGAGGARGALFFAAAEACE